MGEYVLLCPLGKSGGVEVQLGRRKDANGSRRFVVVEKFVTDPGGGQTEQKRFTRRARAATLFEHPALVKTQELGKLKDGIFCIRGFLRGDSLGFFQARAYEKEQAIEPALAAELVAQAAEGLHFVHTLRGSGQEQLGLIHQNIHPDNLVLTASGRVKLINFSLTRKVEPADPSRRTAYLSPEQCMIKEVDARSDVFSLGVVLWELLYGRRLFERQTEEATRSAVIACLVTAVGSAARSVPDELARVCERALARKPDDRFTSAGEMAEALREIAGVGTVGEGVKRVGAFVRSVAGERMQAKREALERLETSGDAPVDLVLLLPATSATPAVSAGEQATDEPAATPASTLPPRPAVPPPDPTKEATPEAAPEAAPVGVLEEAAEEVLEMAAPEPAAPPPVAMPAPRPTDVPAETPDEQPAEPVTQRAIEPPPASGTMEPAAGPEDIETIEPLFEEDAVEVTGESPRREPPPDAPEEPAVAEPVTAPRMETRPPGAADAPAAPPAEPPPVEQPASADLLARARTFYERNRLPCLVGGGLLLVLVVVFAWPSGGEEPADDASAPADTSPRPADAPRPPDEVLAELEREQAAAAAQRIAKPELANIRVVSDPAGCQVWLDGRALAGRTPLENLFVPAGLEYEVTVACKGHEKQSRQVAPGAGAPAVVEFYPPPAGAPDRHFGRLQLTTRPRAWIYLGKKKLGMTPLLGVRLPAGTHQLRIVNKPRRIRRTIEVVIQPDQTTTLQETL